MLAYVYEGSTGLSLKDLPRPAAGEGEVVVKVRACSVCGTDFRTYIHKAGKITPGKVIGHEVIGTIVEVGAGVSRFSKGQRVAVAPALGCGKCRYCQAGMTNVCTDLKTIGFQYDGGFAEYMTIPARAFASGNVYVVPESVPDEQAALAEPIACCINAQESLKITVGDVVAIFGSGFIGCMHAELALSQGAGKVILIEPVAARRQAAMERLPGLVAIDPAAGDVQAAVQDLTMGEGVDVAITACSAGAAQETAIRIAARRGRVSLFGGIPGAAKGFLDSNEIHYKELSVFGVHASTGAHNRQAMQMISAGTLQVGKYISGVYALKDIVKALEAIKNENILKAIIKP